MTNFGAKILNNSVSGLTASQGQIAAIGNNISNVNTPGYTRRSAELQTRVGSAGGSSRLDVGSGVEITAIKRFADQYIEARLRGSIGTKGQDELKNDYLSRIEGLFNLTGEEQTIGTTITAFYDAWNQLSVNPSSLELRSNLIQRGQDLVGAINTTYNSVANLQTELDQRLGSEIDSVNTLTTQIAALNQRIGQREAAGGVAADERDQRDQILNKLAEKMSFTVLETGNGMVNISLSNGFVLVNGGTARSLRLTESPSFALGVLPPSLGGGILRYIVFDYESGGGAQLDLTEVMKEGSGSIGGILQLRGYADVSNTNPFQADGPLVQVASRVEAIARNLLIALNDAYLGVDEDTRISAPGRQPSSFDLNGNSPGVFGVFTFQGAIDSDGDGVPEATDLTATGFSNFASRIQFGVSTPQAVAAGRDLDTATEGSVVAAPGDSQNAQAMMARIKLSQTFSSGSFSLTGTFEEAYNEMVTYVGNVKSSAELNAKVALSNYNTVANQRDELSAVSLDEEFTKLIQAQKAFQASARLIRTADQMLDEIVALI